MVYDLHKIKKQNEECPEVSVIRTIKKILIFTFIRFFISQTNFQHRPHQYWGSSRSGSQVWLPSYSRNRSPASLRRIQSIWYCFGGIHAPRVEHKFSCILWNNKILLPITTKGVGLCWLPAAKYVVHAKSHHTIWMGITGPNLAPGNFHLFLCLRNSSGVSVLMMMKEVKWNYETADGADKSVYQTTIITV